MVTQRRPRRVDIHTLTVARAHKSELWVGYSFVRTVINSVRAFVLTALIFQKYTMPYAVAARANCRERRALVCVIALFLTSLSVSRIIIALICTISTLTSIQ